MLFEMNSSQKNFIIPEVERMLRGLPKSNSSDRVFLKKKRNSSDLIPFDDFQADWRRLVELLNLGDLVFHDLRHSAITNLRKLGNDMSVIMKASGHKTIAMFLRYNLVDEEDLKKIKWK